MSRKELVLIEQTSGGFIVSIRFFSEPYGCDETQKRVFEKLDDLFEDLLSLYEGRNSWDEKRYGKVEVIREKPPTTKKRARTTPVKRKKRR